MKNVCIGNFLFGGLNAVPEAAEKGILVTFDLDLDGILHIHAKERETGREIEAVIENAWENGGQEETASRRRRVASLWGDAASEQEVQSPVNGDGGLPEEAQETVDRARRLLDRASEEDREEMIALIEDLHAAVREGQLGEIAETREELEEILYYLE